MEVIFMLALLVFGITCFLWFLEIIRPTTNFYIALIISASVIPATTFFMRYGNTVGEKYIDYTLERSNIEYKPGTTVNKFLFSKKECIYNKYRIHDKCSLVDQLFLTESQVKQMVGM